MAETACTKFSSVSEEWSPAWMAICTVSPMPTLCGARMATRFWHHPGRFELLDSLPARRLRQPDLVGDFRDRRRRIFLQDLEDVAIDPVHEAALPDENKLMNLVYKISQLCQTKRWNFCRFVRPRRRNNLLSLFARPSSSSCAKSGRRDRVMPPRVCTRSGTIWRRVSPAARSRRPQAARAAPSSRRAAAP